MSDRRLSATVVRLVETQYVAATMRLVDTPAEQAVLEAAIETSKPPLPPECAGLHYLLSTPFRYAPSPWPSRFRGPRDPGVFYAAERDRTALAELAHWRLKVLLDAVDLREIEPTAHTLFKVKIRARTMDALALEPARRRHAVLDPHDYTAAQQWAQELRPVGTEAIRYPSVRDRPDGVCWAVLRPTVFRSLPTLLGEWFIRVSRDGVWCRSAAHPPTMHQFTAADLQVMTGADSQPS